MPTEWQTPSGWYGTVENHGWVQTGVNAQGQEVWQPVQTWRETRDGWGEAQGPPSNPWDGDERRLTTDPDGGEYK